MSITFQTLPVNMRREAERDLNCSSVSDPSGSMCWRISSDLPFSPVALEEALMTFLGEKAAQSNHIGPVEYSTVERVRSFLLGTTSHSLLSHFSLFSLKITHRNN